VSGFWLTAATGQAAEPTQAELEAMGLDQAQEEETAPSPAPEGVRAVVRALMVVQEGDTTPGVITPIDNLNSPAADGLGRPGFTGDQTNEDDFVWYDADAVWLNSDAVGATLSGAEGTSGVGSTGQFIYSPSIDGNDGVWTDLGELAREEVQAPGFPAGTISTFHSRPTMIPGGQAYWVSGFNETGGTSTEGRMLYTSPDRTPGSITVVLRSDDLVGGLPIDRSSGVGFDYDFSEDGAHHIHELLLDTGSTSDDGIIYVDGAIVAQESLPTGQGDNWDNFDDMGINNSGNHLFSGDTDGVTTSDEFIAYNGAIVIREGDVIGGIPLVTTASVTSLAINDEGHAVHAWSTGSGDFEYLFFSCDAANLATSSQMILAVGDELDFTGNGFGDAFLVDINSPSHLFSLDGSGVFHLNVDVDYPNEQLILEANISIPLPPCDPIDDLKVNEVDYVQPLVDNAEFIEIFNPTARIINLGGYAVELVNDQLPEQNVYETIFLPGVDLLAGDYFVICGDAANVFNCDLDTTPDVDLIDNSEPGAVALVFVPREGALQTILDTVSYGGNVPGYTEGTGVTPGDNDTDDYFGISRYPNGVDTDNNSVDFSGRCHSPGEENLEQSTECEPIPVELMTIAVE
jgi:hypothetical protein